MPWLQVGNKFKKCNKQTTFKQCLSSSSSFFFLALSGCFKKGCVEEASWHLTWLLSPRHLLLIQTPGGAILAQSLSRRWDTGSV